MLKVLCLTGSDEPLVIYQINCDKAQHLEGAAKDCLAQRNAFRLQQHKIKDSLCSAVGKAKAVMSTETVEHLPGCTLLLQLQCHKRDAVTVVIAAH